MGWSLPCVESSICFPLAAPLCLPWKNRLLLLLPFYLPINNPSLFISVLRRVICLLKNFRHISSIFLVLILLDPSHHFIQELLFSFSLLGYLCLPWVPMLALLAFFFFFLGSCLDASFLNSPKA